MLISRKASAAQRLSSIEAAWLETAVRLLIRRVADVRPPTTLPILTMADLPSLQGPSATVHRRDAHYAPFIMRCSHELLEDLVRKRHRLCAVDSQDFER